MYRTDYQKTTSQSPRRGFAFFRLLERGLVWVAGHIYNLVCRALRRLGIKIWLGNQQSPPDLGAVWEDFKNKIKEMMGEKPSSRRSNGDARAGGGGDDKPPSHDQGFMSGGSGWGIFGVVAVLFFLIWMSTGIFIVQEGQTAAILRFGRFVNLTDKAGIQYRWPSPIETHEVINVQQLRQVEVGYRRGNSKDKEQRESLMLTDDENIIDIQFAVQYRISADGKSAADFIFNNRYSDDNTRQFSEVTAMRQVAETAMREVVGRSKMDFVLYEGKEQIAKEAERIMQQILDRYQSGILVVNVTLQNAQPPEPVQAAFDEAVKAGQDRERQKNEGQAYANDVIPKARGAASRLLEEAAGYKQRVIANAEGEAKRFRLVSDEYAKAPRVTRDRIYIETLQHVYQNSAKVMVDVRQSSPLLYLPLDRLQAAMGATIDGERARADAQVDGSPAGSSGATRIPNAPGVSSAPSSPSDNRRDGQRNRDREVR